MPRLIIEAGEPSSAVCLSWERQYELAGIYSRFYRELTGALAPRLAHEFGCAPAAAAVLVREAVVPLGYLYLDRLLRLDRVMAGQPAEWAVADAPPLKCPARIEQLQSLAPRSKVLARSVWRHQAALWNLPVAADMPAEEGPQRQAANHLFNPSTFSQKVRRVLRMAWRGLTGPRKRIPVLSMGYSIIPLKNAGFYGTYLTDISGKTGLDDGSPDPVVRGILRRHLEATAAGPLADFLQATAFPCVRAPDHSVLDNFVEFVVSLYPSSLLEKAAANLASGVATLTPFAPAPLIVGERGGLESAMLIAACKVLGMPFVNFQHGGWIGYLIDQTSTLEMEEYLCERFITWGWTQYPDYPPHPAPPVTPLPNPWLSERAKLWRRLRRRLQGRARRYDFLFFSSRLNRFPTIPSGAYQLTMDYERAYGEFLVGLVREAHRQQQTILHKPYNEQIAGMLAATLREMAQAGGGYYHCMERLDKGLSAELLSQCNVMLWDQPGTGFLECLAGGIPTLCCWPRIYSREEPYAVDAFAALEAAGIVHRTPQSLFAEARRLKEIGVDAWMKAPSRMVAVAAFSQKYCRAEDNWADAWEKFLRGE